LYPINSLKYIYKQSKKQNSMKKTTITISNPNPYKSKNTGTAMVSYVVTGEGAEQYRQDQLAKGVDSADDNGNPLIHFTASASLKYGTNAELERTTLASGEVIWFMDNAEQKQLDLLIAGADETTKAVYAQQKLEEMKAFARALANNRSNNIAKLQAKTNAGIDSM
jgi:hypothetical protein